MIVLFYCIEMKQRVNINGNKYKQKGVVSQKKESL